MSKRILIVDEDRLLRRTLSVHLEQAGHHSMTASSGEEALLLADRQSSGLILLDIGLPDLDGFDVLRRLWQAIQAPTIFVTARRRELDEIVGLKLGADDYIIKLFDVDVLVAHIRAVLRRSHGARREAPALSRSGPSPSIQPGGRPATRVICWTCAPRKRMSHRSDREENHATRPLDQDPTHLPQGRIRLAAGAPGESASLSLGMPNSVANALPVPPGMKKSPKSV